MAFTPIETQEQLDAIIGERLKRDRETQAKKFDGWKSPEDIEELTKELNEKITSLESAATAAEQTIKEKDDKIAEGAKYRADLEKTRIALKAGLDIKYADRLRGDKAEEWEADAKELAKDFAAARATVPIGSLEPNTHGSMSTRDKFAEWMKEQVE